jgi:hypothetical protein
MKLLCKTMGVYEGVLPSSVAAIVRKDIKKGQNKSQTTIKPRGNEEQSNITRRKGVEDVFLRIHNKGTVKKRGGLEECKINASVLVGIMNLTLTIFFGAVPGSAPKDPGLVASE